MLFVAEISINSFLLSMLKPVTAATAHQPAQAPFLQLTRDQTMHTVLQNNQASSNPRLPVPKGFPCNGYSRQGTRTELPALSTESARRKQPANSNAEGTETRWNVEGNN